jgi:hypothetical protein
VKEFSYNTFKALSSFSLWVAAADRNTVNLSPPSPSGHKSVAERIIVEQSVLCKMSLSGSSRVLSRISSQAVQQHSIHRISFSVEYIFAEYYIYNVVRKSLGTLIIQWNPPMFATTIVSQGSRKEKKKHF